MQRTRAAPTADPARGGAGIRADAPTRHRAATSLARRGRLPAAFLPLVAGSLIFTAADAASINWVRACDVIHDASCAERVALPVLDVSGDATQPKASILSQRPTQRNDTPAPFVCPAYRPPLTLMAGVACVPGAIRDPAHVATAPAPPPLWLCCTDDPREPVRPRRPYTPHMPPETPQAVPLPAPLWLLFAALMSMFGMTARVRGRTRAAKAPTSLSTAPRPSWSGRLFGRGA